MHELIWSKIINRNKAYVSQRQEKYQAELDLGGYWNHLFRSHRVMPYFQWQVFYMEKEVFIVPASSPKNGVLRSGNAMVSLNRLSNTGPAVPSACYRLLGSKYRVPQITGMNNSSTARAVSLTNLNGHPWGISIRNVVLDLSEPLRYL